MRNVKNHIRTHDQRLYKCRSCIAASWELTGEGERWVSLLRERQTITNVSRAQYAVLSAHLLVSTQHVEKSGNEHKMAADVLQSEVTWRPPVAFNCSTGWLFCPLSVQYVSTAPISEVSLLWLNSCPLCVVGLTLQFPNCPVCVFRVEAVYIDCRDEESRAHCWTESLYMQCVHHIQAQGSQERCNYYDYCYLNNQT